MSLGLEPVRLPNNSFLKSGAEVAPYRCWCVFSIFKQGLHDEQGWNAHKDRGITALNLFIELRQFFLGALQKLAKLIELLAKLRLADLVLGDAPRIFKFTHHFYQRFIVFQLRIDKFNISLVGLHELPVCVKGLTNVIR